MGGQQSQMERNVKMTSFHLDRYKGTWYTVSGNRMKICHHWDAKSRKVKLAFKYGRNEKKLDVASIDVNKVGNIILESGSNYTIHWTDYDHYSFVTINGQLYVLSRSPHLRNCETELITLALRGCNLHDRLIYITEDVDEGMKVKEKEDIFAKTDFWSEVGKNSDNKNTYESKFSC